MTDVLQGVRILEVAEQTFVPAASAMLADFGAEVIKVEHVERGDAMRGLASSGMAFLAGDVHVLLEHSNRGKKSIGLDLGTPEGLDILYKLAATSDVFLTNKLRRVRTKLSIDVDDIRAHNEKIIYVRGTGQGERGPDADKGSYDNLSFWARSGTALAVTKPEYGGVVGPPGPGFGDSIGAMTIAGAIAMALFHRERTGEGTVVDVSLMSSAMWAMGQTIGLSLMLNMGWRPPPGDMLRNPLVANYLTKDERWLAINCLQAGAYWPLLCEAIGRPELAVDERFATHEALLEHCAEAMDILREVFAARTVEEWRTTLETFRGQWTVVQDTLEAARDRQSVANGYLQPCQTATGHDFELVASPMQFNDQPAQPKRAPEFNEHGDEILAELGIDWDTVVDLKVRGVVA